jgi:streptomycin 6-kinase
VVWHDRRVTNAIEVPGPVAAKARAWGAEEWLAGLPDLVAELAGRWSLTVGSPFVDATEAWVAEAMRADGERAVLKLIVPRPGDHARSEITALRLADGGACVRLLAADEAQNALLLERLGPSIAGYGMPLDTRLKIFTWLAPRVWRPAAGHGLPTGAEKGRWLIDFITRMWDELDRPCTESAVDYAIACARRRIAAHDDERSVLVHGDIHQWNTVRIDDDPRSGYALVDPDGLLAEPEYDLGVIMREDPVELLAGDPWDRAWYLAAQTDTDVDAIWEWGVTERVSTGLLLTSIGVQPGGRQMLEVADRISVNAGSAG